MTSILTTILTHVPITLHRAGQEEHVEDICRYSLENIVAKKLVHPTNSWCRDKRLFGNLMIKSCNLATPQSTDIQDSRRNVAITKLLLLRSLVPITTNTASIEVWLTWQLTQEQPNNNNNQLWSGLKPTKAQVLHSNAGSLVELCCAFESLQKVEINCLGSGGSSSNCKCDVAERNSKNKNAIKNLKRDKTSSYTSLSLTASSEWLVGLLAEETGAEWLAD
uniref:Uncharacterized protein n=1 Tax=Glossina pallidipes TaxID=7398 RepID=A0A1B0ADC1_GLOPL